MADEFNPLADHSPIDPPKDPPPAPPAESAHEALTVAMAQAMLQITHIVGAKEAHDSLKKALHEFSPDHLPEAYRDAPEVEERQHGDEQPE